MISDNYCIMYVSVSNVHSFEAISKLLMLHVLDAPSIIQQVMDHIGNEQDIAFFSCQATGEPVPTISWYFNDVPVDVTNTMKYTVFSLSPGRSDIRISNVQSSDVGTYTCNATNVVSSDTSSGVLTVNGEIALICIQFAYTSYVYSYTVQWNLGYLNPNVSRPLVKVFR